MMYMEAVEVRFRHLSRYFKAVYILTIYFSKYWKAISKGRNL